MAKFAEMMAKARSTRTPALVEQLRELFEYDKETGEIFWKRRLAGSLNNHGYLQINALGHQITNHRLAFALVNGYFPEEEIDHINRNRADNRWENLQQATRSQNLYNTGMLKNNTSGFKGVCATKAGNWEAAITIGNKKRYLGRFGTPEEAHEAYLAARASHLRSLSK